MTGSVLANDSDVDQGTLLQAVPVTLVGQYGTLRLQADGSYRYALNGSSELAALAAGETRTDTFAYQATDGGMVAGSTLTITVVGGNDAPVAEADTAAVQEDGRLVATGNVLGNDSDVDTGTILRVRQPGTLQGLYGQLMLQADGGYRYELDNTSAAVQALAAGETVTETFQYTVADGAGETALSSASLLSVQIAGHNDAPVVVGTLADQAVTAGQDFSLPLDPAVFTDIDHQEVLTWSVTLADGGALPDWLHFDAQTLQLAGTATGTAARYALRVVATDRSGAQAVTGFTLAITADEACHGRTLIGTAGHDVLTGTNCDDVLEGAAGADVMIGRGGDDVYIVDTVCREDDDHGHGNAGVGNGEDAPPPGHDHDHNDGPGTGPGCPGQAKDFSKRPSFLGGQHWHPHTGAHGPDDDHGHDMHGHPCVPACGDEVVERADEGYDTVRSTVSYVLPEHVEALQLLGSEALNGTGNGLANWLRGNSGRNALAGRDGDDLLQGGAGDDTLQGDGGTDLLQGEAGRDVLRDGDGNGLLDGGEGADILVGNAQASLFIGGKGKDVLTLGGGCDVVAFNRGDGRDEITSASCQAAGALTVSLGGGIRYADLTFRRDGKDLVLGLGAEDSLTFDDWYAAPAKRPAVTLQVIAESMTGFSQTSHDSKLDDRVEAFDLSGLAARFEAESKGKNKVSLWSLNSALAQFQLAGSDDAALGGNLAYQYGLNGTLNGMAAVSVQPELASAQFGRQRQRLMPLSGLSEAGAKLG